MRAVYCCGLVVRRGRFEVFELVGGFYPVMSIRRVNLWDESGWDYNMSNIHCAMDTLLSVLSFWSWSESRGGIEA